MEERTIMEQQDLMTRGEATARSLAEGFLQRIAALDRQGPCVNAVIETNPDALEVADRLDEERRAGRVRGPLHGISILLKDNIDTHDGMQTTAGSVALEGSAPPRDAFLVERLREAGAVLLGKTNLSEWANARGSRSTSGWSSRGGLTRNPYALDRSACGSSSGSGAAVASNMCAAAVGTETDGSIVCPANTNGVVGIKPTVGLVSRSGIIPIAHSQDTAGPMARTVTDAAILLGALAGVDARDPATRGGPRGAVDYRSFLDPDGLRGARIGVARHLAGKHPRISAVFDACLVVLKSLGAVLVDPVIVPNCKKLGKLELELLSWEFKADLNAYLLLRSGAPRNAASRSGVSRNGASRSGAPRVRSLEEVIRFNEENRARVMPHFGQEFMTTAQEKGPLTSPIYRNLRARIRRLSREDGIDTAVKRHRLDAIVVPTGGPAWLIDLLTGDAPGWDVESTTPAAVAGYPHITVPAGYIRGLPVGLSFFARAWQEPALLRLAFAFEQATRVRQTPRFAPAADLSTEDRIATPPGR